MGHLLKGILDISSVIWIQHVSMVNLLSTEDSNVSEHTNLIQLDGVKLCAHFAQCLFSSFAIGTVRLAEDSLSMSVLASIEVFETTSIRTNSIFVDDLLSLGLCGGHCCRVYARGEESA